MNDQEWDIESYWKPDDGEPVRVMTMKPGRNSTTNRSLFPA
jgi:hypothetical protein